MIAVHLVGGLLGSLLLGFFADTTVNGLGFDGVFFGGGAELLARAARRCRGDTRLLVVVSYIIAMAIDKTMGLRVGPGGRDDRPGPEPARRDCVPELTGRYGRIGFR